MTCGVTLAPDSLCLLWSPVRVEIMSNDPVNTASRRTMSMLSGPSDCPTTRWTLVVAAAGGPQQKDARSALVSLCEGYWYPLYAYVRRRGYPADQAQDLTQELFVRLLDGRYLDRADAEKGRFRAFVLTSLKFFLADEADRNRAQKRGGGNVLSLEVSSGEERYQRDPAHSETPERIFERRWALSGTRSSRGEIAQRVRESRPPGAFRTVEGVPSRGVRCAVCGAGSRNEHFRGGAQGGHSQASQTVSRTLSPGNCRDCGRSRRSGVRTPFSGGRVDGKVAPTTCAGRVATPPRGVSRAVASAPVAARGTFQTPNVW